MSPKVLLNGRLYRYKHNNVCQALHKIIAITFKQTFKIDVLLAITNSNPCGKCLSRPLFTITNSNSVAIKKQKYVKNNQWWKNIKIHQNDLLKNIRTQNNKIKQRSYTRNHSIQACKIDVAVGNHKQQSVWQVPL